LALVLLMEITDITGSSINICISFIGLFNENAVHEYVVVFAEG